MASQCAIRYCFPSRPGCDGSQEDGCSAGEGAGTGPPGHAGDLRAGLATVPGPQWGWGGCHRLEPLLAMARALLTHTHNVRAGVAGQKVSGRLSSKRANCGHEPPVMGGDAGPEAACTAPAEHGHAISVDHHWHDHGCAIIGSHRIARWHPAGSPGAGH